MQLLYQLLRSAAVGLTGTALNLFLLYAGKTFLSLHYLTAATLANILTLIFIFLGDKYYTFRQSSGNIHTQFFQYATLYVVRLVASVFLLALVVEVFAFHYLIAQALVITVISFAAFLVLKFWIFHSHGWFGGRKR
ncbi:GtrA family protein [Candidatus Woesearchaeota archaeon]|nr:GtrA family protein [Candidatus Woesearchaeota archaeon]